MFSGYVHAYPGLFETELFDPEYVETVTRIRTDPELFENPQPPIRSFSKTLSKVDLSKTEVSYWDLLGCEHGIRIFSATVSKVINNGLPKRWLLLHVHTVTGGESVVPRRKWVGLPRRAWSEKKTCTRRSPWYFSWISWWSARANFFRPSAARQAHAFSPRRDAFSPADCDMHVQTRCRKPVAAYFFLFRR